MSQVFRKSLIFFTAIFSLLGGEAIGETLNAQATFVVHESDMTQWLQDQTGKLLIPNQVIASQVNLLAPYQSVLSNLSFQGEATLTWTKSSTTNVWTFDGQTTNATLYATSFQVHDSFPVTVNGSVISVRVDADCQNLQMNLPGQWKIHGDVPVAWTNGVLGAPVQNFTMTPSAQVPTVTIGSCQGPSGMGPFLNQEVAVLFAQPAKIQSSMLSELQTFINSEIGTLTAAMGKPYSFSALGANVAFTPTTGSSLPNGTWLLDGPIVFTAPNGTGTTTVARDYVDANLSDAGASGFAFANSLLPQILAFGYRAGLFDQEFSSSSIPQFTSFMQSRMEQFFVWQDLWNFPTSTVFDFNFAPSAAPEIPSIKNITGGVQLNVSAPIDVVMSAPTQFGMLPYVEFQSERTPAEVQLNAEATKAGALQVIYSVSSLNVGYSYRPEFDKVRRPTMGINTTTIAQSVAQSEQNQLWTYQMPASSSPIPGYQLLFKNFMSGTATFRLEMTIQELAQ